VVVVPAGYGVSGTRKCPGRAAAWCCSEEMTCRNSSAPTREKEGMVLGEEKERGFGRGWGGFGT